MHWPDESVGDSVFGEADGASLSAPVGSVEAIGDAVGVVRGSVGVELLRSSVGCIVGSEDVVEGPGS